MKENSLQKVGRGSMICAKSVDIQLAYLRS
jgi:hypothetical protein